MKTRHILLATLLIGTAACTPAGEGITTEPELAVLTAPPMVPPPVGNRGPKHLIVELEVIEKEMEIADGVTYQFWTFGGTVPGSFIRTRVGDTIEFRFKNAADSKFPHNIDLHAVTGPGGGAEATFAAPGQSKTFTFKTLNPGLYVYHCATAPVGMHIANGMYGLILVEPEGGLPPVDREYYVMQGDFYTEGEFGMPGLQPFSQAKAIDEDADYVLFNGRVGALTGDNALTAEVGETVRLFVGNGGPNLVSSFHVIGEIFDRVYTEGGTSIHDNVQTTLVPAGGAAIVEYRVDVPGRLVLVDHSIFRAFNKGAIGIMNVGGAADTTIFSAAHETAVQERVHPGKTVYDRTCLACHGSEGEGIAGIFPPVAKSDYLNADKNRAIDAVLHGLSGPVTVNGIAYNNAMPAQGLNDQDVAAVLTFIYSRWDNNGTVVTPEDVAARRRN